MNIKISGITKHVGLPFVDEPLEKQAVNYLLILMLLQSKTADFAAQNQAAVAKKRRSAAFAQALNEELKKKGNFSLDTSEDFSSFVKQINEQFDGSKLGYSEALMLTQMNKTFSKLETLKSDMEKLKIEIKELEGQVSQLKSDRSYYQRELDDYTSKYKNGGFIVPGYNAYLMTKILEYKGKRDDADNAIALKSAEIEMVKKPKLDAMKADVQRIQNGFLGNNETEATKMMANANDELAQFEALLNAAMSSSTFLK